MQLPTTHYFGLDQTHYFGLMHQAVTPVSGLIALILAVALAVTLLVIRRRVHG